jgi:hypothetical protein
VELLKKNYTWQWWFGGQQNRVSLDTRQDSDGQNCVAIETWDRGGETRAPSDSDLA